MGFSQGVSGIKAASTSLDVIGNNIANSQTVGFKGSRAEFGDLYAGAVGLGARVTGNSQDFSSGSIEQSSRDMDLAINGSGFFRLESGDQVVFSRNGQFTSDKDGYIVNSTGGRLTGYVGDATGGETAAIKVEKEGMPAKATGELQASYNLDSNKKVGDTSTGNATIYDSQGNSHAVKLDFTKSDNNKWDVKATVDGRQDLQKSGTIEFDENGQLKGDGMIDMSFGELGNGTAALTSQLNLKGSTQYARDFSNINLNQDGYKAGDFVGVSIDEQGQVIGKYANDKSKVLGTAVLANFSNPNGLEPAGDNFFKETSASGQPLIGTAGSGTLGKLVTSAKESSNVDMSAELVSMIVAQRNYQANSQTIKTQDQVMQTVVSMR